MTCANPAGAAELCLHRPVFCSPCSLGCARAASVPSPACSRGPRPAVAGEIRSRGGTVAQTRLWEEPGRNRGVRSGSGFPSDSPAEERWRESSTV